MIDYYPGGSGLCRAVRGVMPWYLPWRSCTYSRLDLLLVLIRLRGRVFRKSHPREFRVVYETLTLAAFCLSMKEGRATRRNA